MHELTVCYILSGTASSPAVTPENKVTSKKKEQCVAVVEQMFALLDCKTRARDIMTRKVGGAGPGWGYLGSVARDIMTSKVVQLGKGGISQGCG